MSHPDLDAAAQARLTGAFAVPAEPAPSIPIPIPGPAPGTGETAGAAMAPRGRKAALAQRARATVLPIAEPMLDRLTAIVASRIRQRLRSETDELAAGMELMRAELGALAQSLGGTNVLASGAAAHRMGALETNAELLKGELGAFRATLDGFGQAIAPAAGLPGVPTRFAELREQVNALDRQLRAARSTATAPPGTGTGTGTDETRPAEAEPLGTPVAGFDYIGFERRFRGDSHTILQTLSERYGSLLADHQPVLDFGCGRGELVEVLTAAGVDAAGVDSDAGMIEEALGHGRAVHLGDGLEYLRSVPPRSLGSVISIHVAEHLPLPVLVELFELASAALAPGGIFVAETPNPMSLIVLGNSYILDPTHVWPLHPSLLTFLAERAGFRDVDLQFYSPAESYRLEPVTATADAPEWVGQINVALERLNDVLFGPQEYALIARTPPAAS